jgi:uncharacterized OB-fold protein
MTATPDPGATAPPQRLQPPTSPAAEPWWDATRDRRLVVQWCTACERPIHFPREACPACLGTALEFRPASGLGAVYALSTMPKPGNPGMAGREPYVVALVDLDEGVRLLTNLVGPDAAEAGVGDRVAVGWEPLADGRHLPVFSLHRP